jgi:hypothetical protein
MMNVVVWALLTGMVTGGTWVAIVLRRQQRLLSERQQALMEDTNRRLAELDHTYQRLADVEERLDFAERLLSDGRTKPDG